jgi:hypothetical protein
MHITVTDKIPMWRSERSRPTLNLEDGTAAAWAGDTELDGLSRLVLTAGIPWRELAVIRAACRYLRQAGLGLSPGYVEETVRAWPEFVRTLLTHFAARFDPDATDRDAAATAATDLDERLGAIAGDHDPQMTAPAPPDQGSDRTEPSPVRGADRRWERHRDSPRAQPRVIPARVPGSDMVGQR